MSIGDTAHARHLIRFHSWCDAQAALVPAGQIIESIKPAPYPEQECITYTHAEQRRRYVDPREFLDLVQHFALCNMRYGLLRGPDDGKPGHTMLTTPSGLRFAWDWPATSTACILYLLTPPCDQCAYIVLYPQTPFTERHCLKYDAHDLRLYTSSAEAWEAFKADMQQYHRIEKQSVDVEASVARELEGAYVYTIMCGADEMARGFLSVHLIEGSVRKVTKCDE